MKACVIGGGSWGTALAMQLARQGWQVSQLHRSPERAEQFALAGCNQVYLPDHPYPPGLTPCGDPERALAGSRLMVWATPSQTLRENLKQLGQLLPKEAIHCCASKGIEIHSLMTMDEVFCDTLPHLQREQICLLSGPSFAKEVAADLPTAVVVAGHSQTSYGWVAEAFHGGNFRVYHSDDVIGVELGGALKNVIAIACGVSDGQELGTNTRAALITRGLAEISRLAVARGANPLTLAGLAGMGDLVLTCTGGLSRNRRLGIMLGQGMELEHIHQALGQVAEGVTTVRAARALGEQVGVELPITEQIYAMLYERKSARDVLQALLGRRQRAERDEESVI